MWQIVEVLLVRRWGRIAVGMAILSLVGLSTVGQVRPPLPALAPAVPVVPEKKEEPQRIQLVPTPADYHRMALEDAKGYALADPGALPYLRYIANTPLMDGKDLGASREGVRLTSWGLNQNSRAPYVRKPDVVAGGHLIRVNLEWYAPEKQELLEWIALWELLAFDPMFSLLVTRDTLDLAGVKEEDLPKGKRKKEVFRKVSEPQPPRKEKKTFTHAGGPYEAPDDSGRKWPELKAGTFEIELEFKTPPKERTVIDLVEENVDLLANKEIDAARFNHRQAQADEQTTLELQKLLSTQAPVVDRRYFLHRSLTTIKDKKVYASVFGGMYYELRGVKKAKDVLGNDTKATDLDLFFETLGIGNIKGGVTADVLFSRLKSDMRLAIQKSKVTFKPREVSMWNTPAAKENSALGAITGDVKDGDIDVGDDPFANLLTPRRAAREGIFPTANGTLLYVLFDGDGAIQDEVPFDVAKDSTIPDSTQRLQPARGCMICHFTSGNDGWQPLVNDVKRLLNPAGRLDIFDDLGEKDRSKRNTTLSRLVGLYQGSFDKALRRNRDDVAEMIITVGGPWTGGKDEVNAAKHAAVALQRDMDGYWYSSVDARQALLEEGWSVPAERAIEVFNLLHPPDPLAADGKIDREDPTIASLKAGMPVSRGKMALSYSFMLERSKRSPARAKLLAEVN